MNAEVFAEWLRRQGHRVLRTKSSYWFDASPLVYQAFPYHWLIQPDEEELAHFLWRNWAVALRYSTPIEKPLGRTSYHVVYEASTYTLDILDRRSRQNVRKGLKGCRIEQVPLSRLADEGWALEMDTVSRQGRRANIDRARWKRRYSSASDLPGFEAWGAIVDNRLVASILTFRMGDCCEMISQQCHRDFLSLRINNALAFTVTQAMINRSGIRSIFYTMQSLDAPPNVDDFKFRMGYTAKPVRQRVVFHPTLTPFLGRGWQGFLRMLGRFNLGGSGIPKAIGMFQFYFDGRLPMDDQHCPECLRNRFQSRIANGKDEARTA
jgi:hypothetical protein